MMLLSCLTLLAAVLRCYGFRYKRPTLARPSGALRKLCALACFKALHRLEKCAAWPDRGLFNVRLHCAGKNTNVRSVSAMSRQEEVLKHSFRVILTVRVMRLHFFRKFSCFFIFQGRHTVDHRLAKKAKWLATGALSCCLKVLCAIDVLKSLCMFMRQWLTLFS